MSNGVEYGKTTGPMLLAAIPFAALGVSSAMSPMLASGTRLASTVALFGLAFGFGACGWPKSDPSRRHNRSRRSDRPAQLPRQPVEALELTVGQDSPFLPSESRFILACRPVSGVCEVVSYAPDPLPLFVQARHWSRSQAIPVGVRWQVLGDPLPSQFHPSSGTELARPELPSSVRCYSPMASWIAGAGLVFVLSVLTSIVNAHWTRGGVVSLFSGLLGATLLGIALMLFELGLRTRFRIEPLRRKRNPEGSMHESSHQDIWVLRQRSLFGSRARRRWGTETAGVWLIESPVRGELYLLVERENQVESFRWIAARRERSG